jgi:outer membrane immunogenic protein
MRNSKVIVFANAAFVAVSMIAGIGASSAADLGAPPYSRAPATAVDPSYNWNGFYIGLNGGGGYGHTDFQFNNGTPNANHSVAGGLAGGQIGYNWQSGTWVFGLEADADWSNIRGSALCPNPAFVCASNVRDLASFRGRVGYAVHSALFYGTGGVGYANTHYTTLTGGAPAATTTGIYNDDRWGYAAGAGIEYLLAPNWSAKVEYMHYGFGTDTAPVLSLGAFTTTALRLSVDTIKVGINYRFGGPVVARY